ncbi:negative elongation factor A-like [Haliotis rufescens]|uniref:negative elongation factor A-like n=1 Tax=Haliotis rufescens TaxID=6454 RepID=UPI00201F86C9|nr:negative elongation factor A-like [Haliotis rufescens]
MASGDTALWLHNKLGSTDDLWSGRTICSQLSKERLLSILECFHTLQPHVKVKLMLSFLHVPRRNTEVWKREMDEILHMAMMDTDPWVCMVAEILQTFPATGSLNTALEENSQTFAEVLSDLKKSVKKSADVRMLPIECQFLNKTALSNTAGQPPQPVKHFALKRKPKSATLRAELLQKSSEVAANKKNNVPNSVPIKIRSFAKKMDDSTPLKGLPGRSPTTPAFRAAGAGFGRINNTPLSTPPLTNRSNSARKEGKIKFLDLDEVPVGSKEAKRRKKMAEIEAIELQKKEKEAAASTATSATTTTAVTSYTPDYAAGLVPPATPKMPTPAVGTSTSTLSTPTPAYVPAASSRLPTQPAAATPTTASVTLSASTQQARQNLQQQLQQQLGQSQIRTQMIVTQQPGSQSQTVILQPQTTLQQVVTQQQTAVLATTPLQPQQQQQQQQQPALLQQSVQVTAAPQAQAAVAAPAKKGLSLTREQMLEAQEMFKTSNKVTRPEKALILGFMAGSRDNPCPQQGDILNIRLSETEETVQQTDGVQRKMIADTYFQMNYSTGEWKRFKKFRELGAS